MSSRQKKFYLEPRKPSGIYYYIVCDPISHRTIIYKSTKTTDKKQAETIAMDWWTNGIPSKTQGTGIDRKTPFCDYLESFWDFQNSAYFRELETMGKNPHPEHAMEMRKQVKRYYQPFFQGKLLCEVDEEELQRFVVYLKNDRKLASSTVNSARNVAIVALRYAKRKKIIKNFDFDTILRAGGEPRKRGILEQDEVEKLFSLEWPNKRSYIAVFIAMNTGMRMGEVRALRVCDIHEDRISVRHSWGKISNLKSTKNQEIRDIPIEQSVHNEILSYIHQMGLIKPDSLLLPGEKPEKPYDDRQIGRDFHKMLSKIGVDEVKRKERCIVYHSWRHLLAKNLVETGANKAIGMKILGHKTGRIFDIYADHVDKETFNQMKGAIVTVATKRIPKEPIPFERVV